MPTLLWAVQAIIKVEPILRFVVKRRVRSFLIVKSKVFLQVPLCIANTVASVQINLFVFYAAPELLHKYVVTPAALAVHADLYAVVFQHAGEV